MVNLECVWMSRMIAYPAASAASRIERPRLH